MSKSLWLFATGNSAVIIENECLYLLVPVTVNLSNFAVFRLMVFKFNILLQFWIGCNCMDFTWYTWYKVGRWKVSVKTQWFFCAWGPTQITNSYSIYN